MNIESQIGILKYQMEGLRKRIAFLRKKSKVLKALPEGTFCGASLDFDKLSHPEVIKVVRTLGGKWRKSETICSDSSLKGRIDYQTEIDGVAVRCWAGEPPPTCRIVEVEETVPEQVIPAHTRKVRKLICTGKDEPLIVALARANTQ